MITRKGHLRKFHETRHQIEIQETRIAAARQVIEAERAADCVAFLSVAAAGVFGAWDQDLKTPKVLQWSFGVQRQLSGNVTVEAAYVGSRSEDALQAANLNQAYQGSGPVNASAPVNTRRPLFLLNPNIGNLERAHDRRVLYLFPQYR
ncbi:MAG TPA: hypothetical protein VK604_03445 [Bryobacteraceae bacterium]|nr:hypothetical protein [Bryobacteraceae bacterium]